MANHADINKVAHLLNKTFEHGDLMLQIQLHNMSLFFTNPQGTPEAAISSVRNGNVYWYNQGGKNKGSISLRDIEINLES